MKVLANLIPGEGPLPGLQMSTFSLYLHMAEREGRLLSFLLLVRARWGPHPLDLKLITFQRHHIGC